MIFIDCETTGVITNESLPPQMQPRILEIGMLQVDHDLKEVDRYHTLVKPPDYRITPEIQKITGLTQTEIDSGREFAEIVPTLYEFCCGESMWIGHNLPFDLMMIVFELRRIGWEHRFPYPRQQIDTMAFHHGKLRDWGEQYGLQAQTHRAIGDCELLLACFREYTR